MARGNEVVEDVGGGLLQVEHSLRVLYRVARANACNRASHEFYIDGATESLVAPFPTMTDVADTPTRVDRSVG